MPNWIIRALLLLPPLALLLPALPRYLNGVDTNKAFPVTTYITMNVAQTPPAYRAAAEALRDSDARDGSNLVARGRALAAANDRAEALTVLAAGVSRAPALIGGWLELAGAEAPLDRRIAAQLLSVTFVLGPYDYWSAARRIRLATDLWTDLDSDGQAGALRQVRLLWEDPKLRGLLMAYLQAPGGAAMVQRAYAGQPETLRAINRWTSVQKRWFQLRYQP